MSTKLRLEPFMWFGEGMVMRMDADTVFGHKVRGLLPERGEAAIFNFVPTGREPEWRITRYIGGELKESPVCYPTAEDAIAALQEQEDAAG